MDDKIAGRSQYLNPMGKKLMKLVDLGERTSFLDHENLGCTQREREPNENVVEEYREMFESRFSAGTIEKLLGWEEPHAKHSRGHTIWSVMRKSVRTDIAEQLYKVSTPCLDDHNFKKEELEKVTVSSQIVLKCLYLARIDRSDIRFSVNTFAGVVAK